jgi:hypothetical protein
MQDATESMNRHHDQRERHLKRAHHLPIQHQRAGADTVQLSNIDLRHHVEEDPEERTPEDRHTYINGEDVQAMVKTGKDQKWNRIEQNEDDRQEENADLSNADHTRRINHHNEVEESRKSLLPKKMLKE